MVSYIVIFFEFLKFWIYSPVTFPGTNAWRFAITWGKPAFISVWRPFWQLVAFSQLPVVFLFIALSFFRQPVAFLQLPAFFLSFSGKLRNEAEQKLPKKSKKISKKGQLVFEFLSFT